jgi:DNA (cytosine-5)-methyltransferase 1
VSAYYNEFDPQAAAWLRELIKNNLIAPGDVDERSIEDVAPVDLMGYRQCHFFAGIGGWSRALRLAGVPDAYPVWTGSCPCQPFSAAGQGKGFADERHLWPAFFHLIEQCRPGVIFGEQVEGAAGRAWLDLVSSDLEGSGYAVGPCVLPAAGVGAPHGRHRTWWVADANGGLGKQGSTEHGGRNPGSHAQTRAGFGGHGVLGVVGNAASERCGKKRNAGLEPKERPDLSRSAGILEYPASQQMGVSGQSRERREAGFWSSADWIPCRDGKWRPVEPGTFPLAHGIPARVGRLRGYGNAIVPEEAAEFISAYFEVRAAA